MEEYGIALPPDSPYRESINQAILGLQEDGTYQQLYTRWFVGTSSTIAILSGIVTLLLPIIQLVSMMCRELARLTALDDFKSF